MSVNEELSSLSLQEVFNTVSKYFTCSKSNFTQNEHGICLFLDLGSLQIQIDCQNAGCRGYIKSGENISYATPNEQGIALEAICFLLNRHLSLLKNQISIHVK